MRNQTTFLLLVTIMVDLENAKNVIYSLFVYHSVPDYAPNVGNLTIVTTAPGEREQFKSQSTEC